MKSLVKTKLPTNNGQFQMFAYKSEFYNFPHIALVSNVKPIKDIVTVRIHSECMTGDVFGSVRCECGEQLNYAMNWFGEKGGILIYLRQEGRGIGLINKMHTYNLQDQGYNTKEANEKLGFHQDSRDYDQAVDILKDLGITKIRLMTNNPNKVNGFQDSKIEIVERIPIEIEPKNENIGYLKTKKWEMGHIFENIDL